MIGELRHLEAVQMKSESGEFLSLYRSFSDFAGTESLLVHHETLLPGQRASAPHYHSQKEEITIVLAGEPSVWIEGELYALEPGDFVGFTTKTPRAHMLINTSDEPAAILTIGTSPADDVTTFVEVNQTI